MHITTDPNVLTELEIRQLWNKTNSNYDPPIDQIINFFEKVFDCDRLTAQTVAGCVIGGSRAINTMVCELQDLRDDLTHTLNSAVAQVKGLR